MHLLLICIVLITSTYSWAQSVNTRLGGRSAGMGYASYGAADDAALFNNVGALANIKNSSAFFCYEAAAELAGASRKGAVLNWLTSVGTLAVGLFRFGDELYNEQIFSVAFGNRIGITSLATSINYVQYRADGFGTRGTFTVDVGGLTQLTPQISFGAGIRNITQSKIADNEELPVTLVAALGFQPDPQLLFSAEIEKRTGSPVLMKMGFEYGIYKKVFIRSGFNVHPTAAFGGLGTKSNRITCDYAMKFSSELGFAHQASASYQLGLRRKK